LEYTQVRAQGRKLGEKDASKPQVPIINHADVKRLLLFQKAVVEGSLGLVFEACMYFDKWQTSTGEEKENNLLILELLTPVVKTYPAEMSILSTSAGLQCFGGYGYTKEFLAELFFRETRIHAIHEGTTTIQGMDLLGRKVMMQNGKAMMLLLQQIMADIENARQYEKLLPHLGTLAQKLIKLQEITMHLIQVAQNEGPEPFLADATLYLEFFGIVAVAWQWLKQGIKAEELKKAGSKEYSAEFLDSKIHALEYFFEYEVPKTEGLFTRLKSPNHLTVKVKAEEIV
jgi:butyryl-CoA dehydrogenase